MNEQKTPTLHTPSIPVETRNSDILRSTLEPQEDAIVIYASWWKEVEDFIESNEPQLALELLLALGRYSFYGEDYKGSIGEIRRSVMSKTPLIDRAHERYHAASLGGSSYATVSDDDLLTALKSGNYSSNAALGRELGISGQAVGKRLKKLGLTIKDFATKENRLEYLTKDDETEKSSS